VTTAAPDLEQRVAALEAALAQAIPDQVTPNYLTVNPDGTVGASFSGKINAQGVILPPNMTAAQYAQPYAVEWDETASGAQVARIWSGAGGGRNDLVIEALTTADNPSAAQLYLQAHDLAGDVSGIQIQAGAITTQSTISLPVLTIAGPNLGSSFVRLPGDMPGDIHINGGNSTIPFTASSTSGNTQIFHGLGNAPEGVGIVSLQAATFNEVPVFNVFGVTSTYFWVNGWTTAAWTGNAGFFWFALG
jgi:hypothetical protein